MNIMSEILEKIEYQLPVFLQECVLFSDLVHMVQLNDLKNQRFNHITFIGKYSEILSQQSENIYKMNQIVKSQITSIYLEKKIENDYIRPNHSIYSYKYNLIENKDDVLDGMLKCGSNSFGLQTDPTGSGDFYILVNTINQQEKFNVYAYTSEKSNHIPDCYYQCLVFIGKIINPAPYKLEDIEIFEKTNDLCFDEKFKNFLTTQPKICGLNNETGKRIFYINLFGNNPKLNKKFSRKEDRYDIEEFRPKLNKIWEKQLLDENYNSEEDEEYNIIMHQIEELNNEFLNGFIKIGTIFDDTNKESQYKTDTIIELYMLINAEPELQGTLWIYELKDDGSGKTNDDINYLPIKSMTKIGCVYK
jgi:hypothetical protein